MARKKLPIVLAVLLSLVIVTPVLAAGGRAGDIGVIYVTNQDKYFDTFVSQDMLPNQGPFQKLEMGADGISYTEFGPGDPGYLAGRWWIDNNGNNMQDEGDGFVLCPLLGPGRDTP